MLLQTFDIVFVGGGAAGCVAAGRLASANPGLKILIIEAGPHSYNVDTHIIPARYLPNLLRMNQETKNFTLHVAQPSNAVTGRELVMPAGRVMGGGSAVNFMVYTRAAASDYDCWEKKFKNPGWGSKDLIPSLKEIETYTVEPFNPTHGTEGPIKVSYPPSHTRIAQNFLEVVAEYDKEREIRDDFNDFDCGNAYGRVWPKYVSAETGRRSDTAHAFVYGQKNKNLTILTDTRVVRVIFEGFRAVGVEYVNTTSQVEKIAFASKLVVLSAGAFGSPAILERSGIGAEGILQRNGIKQLVDLPGVGEKYGDHNIVVTHFKASPEAETLEDIMHQTGDALSGHIEDWRSTGQGLMTHNGLDAGLKARPTVEEVKQLGPAFEKRWNEFFAPYPDKPLMLAGPFSTFIGTPLPDSKAKYFALLYYSGYPGATGSVHIACGLDPYGPLAFHHGYLEHEADVAAFRWMYKHLREIGRRMTCYRGEVLQSHPNFAEGTVAACNEDAYPVPWHSPKINWTKEDDKAIDAFHRQTIGTAWHGLGTCAMKPRDQGGVVDCRLNVYGTMNLKVADMSICPENVGANTYNTALAIGAKSAVLIAEDLGLKL